MDRLAASRLRYTVPYAASDPAGPAEAGPAKVGPNVAQWPGGNPGGGAPASAPSAPGTVELVHEVEDLRRILERASLPLSEAQRKAWIRTAIERGAYVAAPQSISDHFDVAALQEAYTRFDQRDQQLLSIACEILDASQVATVERVVTAPQQSYDEMLRNASTFRSP